MYKYYMHKYMCDCLKMWYPATHTYQKKTPSLSWFNVIYFPIKIDYFPFSERPIEPE